MTPTPEWTAADEDDADRARAVFRDRGDIINRLITERDEARAEVRDLRAKVAAVEAWIDEAPEQTAGLDLLRQVVASVGRTEPEGDFGTAYVPDLSADFAPGGEWHNPIGRAEPDGATS